MAEFRTQFEELVRSYLPDWQYRREGPEPESALMTALGELLAAAGESLTRLPEKHLREYLRGFGLDRQPGAAAHAYAALYAPHAATVPKGTLFYQNGDGTKLWEAAEDGWAEPVHMTDQLLTGRNKVIRLPLPSEAAPSPLFSFQTSGIQSREVRFAHPWAFSSPAGCVVSLYLEGDTGSLLSFLSQAEWSLTCGMDESALPAPELCGGALRFQLPAVSGAAALTARAGDDVSPPEDAIRRVLLRTERPARPPAAVFTDPGPIAGESWLPFGERLSPWNCCYLSCPESLSLRGGEVTLSWTRSFRPVEDRAAEPDQEPVYRPVMRRLPPPPPPIRDVYAQLVVWEYWDGRSWRPVPGTEDHSRIFSAENSGSRPERMEVRFRWPEDAAPCIVQGLESMWLRWRLCACEGAGWLPARHHLPEITGLRAAARLSDAEAAVSRKCGLDDHFTPVTQARKVLFPNFLPDGDRWWLGFDLPPSGEQFSLYLTLAGRTQGLSLSAWEALPTGSESPLELRDGTDGLAHSGLIRLGGVQGRSAVRFGLRRWWLCLKRDAAGSTGRLPRLIRVDAGAILVRAAGTDACCAGDRFLPLKGGAVSATALTESFGGVAEETDREVILRAQNARHHLDRAVSPLDVEELVCGMLRDVVRTRCLRSGSTVQVAVLMDSAAHHAQAFQLRRAEICRLLERRSPLPTLGFAIHVREPSFYSVHVMAWIQPEPDTGFEETRRLMSQALDRFLDPVTGHFGGGGWQMGQLPNTDQLCACLRAAVPGAVLLRLLPTVTAPDGSELEPGSVQDPFALPAAGVYTIRAVKGGVSD